MFANILEGFKHDLTVEDKNFYKLMLACFIGSIFIFTSFFMPICAYVALIVFLGIAFFAKSLNKVYVLLFTLPFYNVFRCNTEQITFCAYILAFVFVLLFFEFVVDLIKKKRKLNIKNTIIFGVLAIFFILPIGEYSIMNALRLELGIGVIYLCIENKDKLNYKQMVFSLLFSLLYASILSFARYFSPHLSTFLTPFVSYIGNLYRFCGLAFDPNYFGVEVMLLIACITQLYIQNKINYLFYPSMLLLTAFGVLTVSKSFFLVFMIYVILTVIACLTKVKTSQKAKNLLLAFAVIFLVALLIFGRFIHVIFERFTELSAINVSGNDSAINHITTGRSDLWLLYLEDWSSKDVGQILFGLGNNQPYLITNEGQQAMHNVYIEVLYHFGIIGFCLVFGIIIYALISYIRRKEVNFFNYMPLICMLVILFSINSFISYRPYLIVIMLIISFTQEYEVVKEVAEENKDNGEVINNNTGI